MGFDVKNTTKISVLDFVMPYSCRGCGRLGSLLCERCKKNILKPECRDGWIYAVGRREGVLMQLTEDYKYKSIRRTAGVLAELMDRTIEVCNKKGDLILDGEIIVVPMPTIVKHIRERGFDHTLRLAKVLAKRRGWRCDDSLLLRANKTVQVGKNAETRKVQAESAYELDEMRVGKDSGRASSGVSGVNGVTYILVDDVSTTGASLMAARKLLEKVGAKRVIGAVVCVGLQD